MPGAFPRGRETEQRDITREPLVMASKVGGLDPLHGYLKHGNLVVQMRFPYMEFASHAEKFIERKLPPTVPVQSAAEHTRLAVEEPLMQPDSPRKCRREPKRSKSNSQPK